MSPDVFELRAIGYIESEVADIALAPRQPDEGAPPARLRFEPAAGVFSTRSADRPNPIGIHQTRITAIDDLTVDVEHLEAIDGTPIVDIKPVLGTVDER